MHADSDLIIAFVKLIKFCRMESGSSFVFLFHSTLLDAQRRGDNVLENHSRPSVRPSVTKFSRHWIISFFWYFAYWQLTMISSDWRRQIFGKKIRWLKFGSNGSKKKQTQNEVFCHFIEFGSYVFPKITYNDSFWQCLASGTGKIYEKNIFGT